MRPGEYKQQCLLINNLRGKMGTSEGGRNQASIDPLLWPVTSPPTLTELLRQRHKHILGNLQDASSFVSHPTEKGDAAERVWLDALRTYLPARYDVRRGFAIDSSSRYSEQLDIIVHDRFYTPFILKFGGYHVVPVESIYAVFEVKQTLNSTHIKAAQKKTASVRSLIRNYRPTKDVIDHNEKPIFAGILATRSEYTGHLNGPAIDHMHCANERERLDYVCVADRGFAYRTEGNVRVKSTGSWITSFILGFIGALQTAGTVPPIDIESYRDATR